MNTHSHLHIFTYIQIHDSHIDSYACYVSDTTLYACGTVLDIGVMLLNDPIATYHRHLTSSLGQT